MIPKNVVEQVFQYTNSPMVSLYELPTYTPAQMKGDNVLSVKRAIVQLSTVPNIQSAHIFHFGDNGTVYKQYHPKSNPLSKTEVNGVMLCTIQSIQQTHSQQRINIVSDRVTSIAPKRIIQYLKTFQPQDRVLIILRFPKDLIVTGNSFDESACCRIMLDYCPPIKPNVIRKWREGKQQPSSLHFLSDRARQKHVISNVKEN